MSSDPRTANAKRFARNSAGKVVGMNLPWEERSTTKYAIVHAALIDEEQAKGEHVCKFSVLNKSGVPVTERVMLRWFDPTQGEQRLLPGNQDNKHVISSKFSSAVVGPLDILIEDAAGAIISDEWLGLGLPDGAHVSFELAFKERAATSDPEPEDPQTDPETDPDDATPGNDAALTLAVVRIADELGGIKDALVRLAEHFGA